MTPEEQAVELGKELSRRRLLQFRRPSCWVLPSKIGLMARDGLRAWRFKIAVRLFNDLQQFALEAHIDLKPVAPRLLFPILDAATLNENEELHSK